MSSEQNAIDAGEESTPRLANKEFFTGTDLFLKGKEFTVFTLLSFDKEANSVLTHSNIAGESGPVVMGSQDPDGPSLTSLIEGITEHIVEISNGESPYTEEQIRIIAEDISGNY